MLVGFFITWLFASILFWCLWTPWISLGVSISLQGLAEVLVSMVFLVIPGLFFFTLTNANEARCCRPSFLRILRFAYVHKTFFILLVVFLSVSRKSGPSTSRVFDACCSRHFFPPRLVGEGGELPTDHPCTRLMWMLFERINKAVDTAREM